MMTHDQAVVEPSSSKEFNVQRSTFNEIGPNQKLWLARSGGSAWGAIVPPVVGVPGHDPKPSRS